MSTPATLTAASAIARNIAPLAGILLLGWSARNVLYLYFIDTLLAMAVILAGLIRHFQPPVEDEGWAARVNGEVGAIAASALRRRDRRRAARGLARHHAPRTPGARRRAARPRVPRRRRLAGGGGALLLRRPGRRRCRLIRPRTLRLKRRFALVFLRWIALICCSQFVAILPTRYALVALVAVYAALSIWTEIAPDHFLRALPPGLDDGAPAVGRAAGAAPAKRKRRRR